MRITRTTPILIQENPNLWDETKTLKENAVIFGISESHARNISIAAELNFKPSIRGRKNNKTISIYTGSKKVKSENNKTKISPNEQWFGDEGFGCTFL